MKMLQKELPVFSIFNFLFLIFSGFFFFYVFNVRLTEIKETHRYEGLTVQGEISKFTITVGHSKGSFLGNRLIK